MVIMVVIFIWIGGLFDCVFGFKFVISVVILIFSGVCLILILMICEYIGLIVLVEGSNLFDILMYICGVVIGGVGGMF